MNMIEKVARAICWKNGMNPDLSLGGDGQNFLWHEYIDQATAAIEAMKDPSQDMLNACGPRPVMWDKTETSRKLRLQADKMRREDWNTMVDAALATGDS